MKILDYIDMKQKLESYFVELFGNNLKNREISKFEKEDDNSSHFLRHIKYELEFDGCKYTWLIDEYDMFSSCTVYEKDKKIIDVRGLQNRIKEVSSNKISTINGLYDIWTLMIRDGDDIRDLYNRLSRRDKLMEIDENLGK